jgi:hypothetical protein
LLYPILFDGQRKTADHGFFIFISRREIKMQYSGGKQFSERTADSGTECWAGSEGGFITATRCRYSPRLGVGRIKAPLRALAEHIAVEVEGVADVAVGYAGKAAYSEDGIKWTAVADTTFGSTSIGGITYGGDTFVAVGSHRKIAYSNEQE